VNSHGPPESGPSGWRMYFEHQFTTLGAMLSVGKAGSDVNCLLFDILPSLRSGVHVHFHDVLHPFEYPLDWFEAGRAFNEAYLVRAFLSFNEAFRIVLFNTFLEHFHERRFAERMPLCLRNTGGSLWVARR